MTSATGDDFDFQMQMKKFGQEMKTLWQDVQKDQAALLMLVTALIFGGWVLPIAQNILLAHAVCGLDCCVRAFSFLSSPARKRAFVAHTPPSAIFATNTDFSVACLVIYRGS